MSYDINQEIIKLISPVIAVYLQIKKDSDEIFQILSYAKMPSILLMPGIKFDLLKLYLFDD